VLPGQTLVLDAWKWRGPGHGSERITLYSLVLSVLLAAATGAAVPLATPPARSRPHVLRDAAFAAGASAAVAFGKPDIRRALLHDARFANVVDNFTDPVGRVRAGTRRDTDPFWVNGLAHPLSFAAEAIYLKRRGYGNGAAFLFTQAHSVIWEFAIEGCAFEPSGKDLLTDAAGAAAAIWVVHPLTRRWFGPKAPVDVAVISGVGGRLRLTVTARF
jgi:hypothetical protein